MSLNICGLHGPSLIIMIILFILFTKLLEFYLSQQKHGKLHVLLQMGTAQVWSFVSHCPGFAQWEAGLCGHGGTVG